MHLFDEKSRGQMGRRLLLLAALVLAAVVGLTRPHAALGSGPGANTLGSSQSLYAGQSLYSANGEFRLVMQGDGNLVLYRSSGSTSPAHPLWYTSMFVPSSAGARVVMQSDGNLVLYSTANRALWSTKTSGNTGANAYLALQNDGNLVIYTASGKVLWAASSNRTNTTLYPGDMLKAGWMLESADGLFESIVQSDGNFVVYSLIGGTIQPVWATYTSTLGCSSCTRVTMQTDGNLVVYDTSNRALWSSGTWNHSGAYAVLHSGDIMIYDAAKQPLWAGVPTRIKTEIRAWFGPNNANVSEWWHESWHGYLEYGTDFGMAPETPLYAVEGGRVLGAGFYGGGGVVSVKAAPGMSEYYQHLDDISVHSGQLLKPGDLVGYSGGQTSGYDHPATCCSGGPHLEWGINAPASWGSPWDSLGANVNPVPYLRALAK